MFDDWMNVWREAVDSFDRELHADEGGSSENARSMRRQLAAARSAITRIDTEIEQALRDATGERDAQQVCIRRQTMAAAIPDEETARIAGEYAERHAQRADLYERKTAILQEERALMAHDLEIMESEFNTFVSSGAIDADATGDTRDSPNDSRRTSILDDDERLQQDRQDLELARMRRERAANEKLEELKRRMRG